jgi:hypothetical protein
MRPSPNRSRVLVPSENQANTGTALCQVYNPRSFRLVVAFFDLDRAGTSVITRRVAAVHGMEYLVTWNCRHIANAWMRPQIEEVIRDLGYEPPVLCTPEELLEDQPYA